jgi:hypothetical protein
MKNPTPPATAARAATHAIRASRFWHLCAFLAAARIRGAGFVNGSGDIRHISEVSSLL